MAKVFRFTDGSTADSVSGTGPFPANTPFNTGTARTRTATRQAIFDELDAALVAAGWTQYSKTAQRAVYESAGEVGNENIGLELNLLSGRYLHFNLAPKLDSSNELDGGIGNNVSSGGGADTAGRWDLTSSDFTADFFILVDRDHLVAAFQNSNHTDPVHWVSIGRLKRSNIIQQGVHTLAANASAGAYVTLDVTGSGDPIASGYRPGDTIDIVETAKVEAPAARRLYVVDVTTTSLTVLHLPVDFHAGALIGGQASPLIRAVSNDVLPDDTNLWSSPFVDADFADGGATAGELLASALSLPNGETASRVYFSANPGYASSGEYGSGANPNNRTQRFTCRNLSIGLAGTSLLGVHPHLIAFPGNAAQYPHDWYLANRINPDQYFVSFRPTSATAQRWGVGPTI